MGLFLQGFQSGFRLGMFDNLCMLTSPFYSPFYSGFCGNIWGCYRPSFTMYDTSYSMPLPAYISEPDTLSFNSLNYSPANINFSDLKFSLSNLSDSLMNVQRPAFQLSDIYFPTINSSESKTNKSYGSDDEKFEKMLEFVLKWEGGLVDNKNDKGGKTNKGIRQETYDRYRKDKKLNQQDVSKLTDTEMREIYYERFYKASGADKISDPRLALYVFDTAVNMGPGRAKEFLKESNGDLKKFEQLRRAKYKSNVDDDPSQAVFLKGWNNRVDDLVEFAKNYFSDSLDVNA